jgi:intracellular septation protein A
MEELGPVPLWGYVDAYQRGWSQHGNWGDAVFALVLLAGAVCVIARWWRRRTVEMTLALPFAVLVPFLTATVINLGINSFRVLAPALTFVVIDWYAENQRQAATDETQSSTSSPRIGSVTAP